MNQGQQEKKSLFSNIIRDDVWKRDCTQSTVYRYVLLWKEYGLWGQGDGTLPLISHVSLAGNILSQCLLSHL